MNFQKMKKIVKSAAKVGEEIGICNIVDGIAITVGDRDVYIFRDFPKINSAAELLGIWGALSQEADGWRIEMLDEVPERIRTESASDGYTVKGITTMQIGNIRYSLFGSDPEQIGIGADELPFLIPVSPEKLSAVDRGIRSFAYIEREDDRYLAVYENGKLTAAISPCPVDAGIVGYIDKIKNGIGGYER